MNRKEFFRNFAIGGGLLITAPAIFNSCSDGTDEIIDDSVNNPGGNTIDLNNEAYAALKTVGGFAYKGDIIVIRTADATYIALSKICTHEGCTVEYNKTGGDIVCNCHGSKFTTTGSVKTGPASSNLKLYNVKVEGNTLTIS